MKKTKIIISVILSLLAILAPVLTVFGIAFLTPPVYSDTFVGALDEKVERLRSIEEPKIVVVGGSSVAFGLDSEMMEEYLDMPVVNFGLYAALGTKLMLDLSLSGIGEGDVVVLAPELDAQTLSLYFSSETTLEAFDGNYSLMRYLEADNILSMLGGSWKHAVSKLSYLRNGAPDPEGIYNSKNLNEYGDIVIGLRTENVMNLYYDPTTVIDLKPEIVDAEFVDYLNGYIDECERRGARVCFTYCPMNSMALAKDMADTEIAEFTDYLEENIDCEFVSLIDSYIMDVGYFYDTNFHLNDAGVVLRTKTLIEDLMLWLGNIRAVDVAVPEPPELPKANVRFFGEDENAKYFTYETMENGALMITGLTELGKSMEELTIPLGSDTYKVMAIGAGAFSEGVCKRLTVTEDTNLRNFLDGCLEGSDITDMYIYYDFVSESEKLSPASYFYGITIHVPPASQYTTHYDWRDSSGGYELVTDIVKER